MKTLNNSMIKVAIKFDMKKGSSGDESFIFILVELSLPHYQEGSITKRLRQVKVFKKNLERKSKRVRRIPCSLPSQKPARPGWDAS
jgi:hypothetical protein